MNNTQDPESNTYKKPSGTKPLKCLLCKKRFKLKSSLLKHTNMIHRGEIIHKCEHCEEKFGTLTKLKKHEALHKVNFTLYKCGKCHQNFQKMPHLCNFLKCDFCEEIFHFQDNLNQHLQSVHPDKTIFCDFCAFTTYTKEDLKIHIENSQKLTAIVTFTPTESVQYQISDSTVQRMLSQVLYDAELSPTQSDINLDLIDQYMPWKCLPYSR